MSVVALVSTTSLAQSLSTNVEMHQRAATLDRVLGALSNQSGFRFEASPSMANEVLLVDVKSVTLGELTTRIAAATRAEWHKTDASWRLQRTNSDVRGLLQLEMAAMAPRYADAIKQLRARVASEPVYTKADVQKTIATMKQMRSGTVAPSMRLAQPSSNRALATVLEALDPKVFAQIVPSGRAVFSTVPTRAQERLPNRVLNSLKSFVAEMALYQQAMNEVEKPQPGDDPNQRRIMRFGSVGNVTGDASLGIGKAVLVAGRQGSSPDIQLRLFVADPNGNSLGSGFTVLSPKSLPAAESGAPIKLSPLALEVAKATLATEQRPGGATRIMAISTSPGGTPTFITSGGDSGGKRAIGDLRTALLQPDTRDPQSFGTTEAILACGAASNANVVAWLPDTSFMPLQRQLAREKLSVDALLAHPGVFDLSFELGGGWLVGTPARPVSAIESTVNRASLGNAVRTIDKTQSLSLAQTLKFASSQKKAPNVADLDGFYFSEIDSSASASLVGLGAPSYKAFQFLATLTDPQIQTLLNGTSLALNRLSPASVASLSTDIFTSYDGPTKNARRDAFTFTAGSFGMRAGPDGLENERTEFLFNGMPTVGEISLSKQERDAVLGWDSSHNHSRVMSAQELGMSMGLASAPIQGMDSPPQYTSFFPAKVVEYSFSLLLPDNVRLERTFSDRVIDSSGQAQSFNQLSENFKKAAQQVASGFGNRGARPGGQRRVVPPL